MSKPAELIQIRCNSCWAIADKNNTLFFITNCYHVFCASCLKNNKNYCKVCLKSCATLPINPDLPDEVKMFFKAKSCDKLLDNLHRITTFQENQTKMFHETLTTYDMKNYFKKKTMIKKSIAIKKKYNDLFRQENDLSAKLKAAKRWVTSFVVDPESCFQVFFLIDRVRYISNCSIWMRIRPERIESESLEELWRRKFRQEEQISCKWRWTINSWRVRSWSSHHPDLHRWNIHRAITIRRHSEFKGFVVCRINSKKKEFLFT